MSLINYIATYLLSSKQSPKGNKQFFNWNQLSKVLIIAYDNQLSELVNFINICKNDSISVKVAIIYNGKLEQAPSPHFDHIILDKKQFSFFQIPNHEALQKFNTQFDALINLGNTEQLKALSLSKLIAAKCKIAFFENPIFDMTIHNNKLTNISEYLTQVITYLKMIKTTN